MSTPRDRDLDAVLRSLDAAAPALDAVQQQRAWSTLEAIVARPASCGADPARGGTARSGARQPVPRRRGAGDHARSRRLVLLASAAAVAAAGISVLDGGGTEEMAFASWTPTPAPLTQQEVDLAGPACRDGLDGDGHLDLDRARLQLAERRGDVLALLYWTQNPDVSGFCLARNVPGTGDVDVISSGVGGGDMPALKAPARGYTQGAISQSRVPSGEHVSITGGAAGVDVVGVTIHAGDHTVHASVREGRYVAWWPGRAFGGEAPGPSGEDRSAPVLTYDLTLSDGSIIRDAAGTRPR
ncbi:hypothetical protein NUM3379_03270 [Kineococcus sp. NUM-3379]